MLRQLSAGDTTARISITTKNELLAKLQSLLNDTAQSMEQMVNDYHVLAIGLCEQFDALAKIAAGDRTVRAPEDTENELIAKLGVLINKETAALSEMMNETEKTSLELALGLSENFEVLRKVAEGDLTVRAPEESENELLSKLGMIVNRTIVNLKNSWDNLEKSKKQVEKELIERKKAEQTLKDSEEKYRTLTENVNIGIYRSTPESEGKFLEANPALIRMLGFDNKEELLKINVNDSYNNKEDRKIFSRKISDKGFVKDEELLLKKRDGELLWGSVSAVAVYDEEGNIKYYDGVIEDITQRKLAEEKQARLFNELETANSELKDFAYIISHDLKAPLRAIGSLVDWLTTDYEDKLDEEGKELLDLLNARVRRMNDLIESVLQYSRVGRIREDLVDVNLNHVVRDVVDVIAPPQDIRIEVDDELPTVTCEKTRMEQVFQNLVGNAVKYMDKPEGEVRIGFAPDDDFWRFHVSDNGPGIDEKYFDKIFQIFQTLAPRDEVESTGIGLTLVKKIIEMYGGRIWVESEVGVGSTFFFTMPQQA
jgi:PAS domain S-box-containing protein